MDGETLKSRLAALLQKSRKAVRLYTSFDKSGFEKLGERGSWDSSPFARKRSAPAMEQGSSDRDAGAFTALQLEQWQAINTDLQRQLTLILDRPHTRLLGSETIGIRDRFYGMWRTYEAELRQKQSELGEAVSRGDFVKAAVLAKSAVILKAREQAAEAAHHEIQIIADRFRLCNSTGEHLPENVSRDRSRYVEEYQSSEELVSVTLTDEPIKLQAQNTIPRRPSLKAAGEKDAGNGRSKEELFLESLTRKGADSAASELESGDAVHGRPLAKVIQLRR